MVYGWVVVGAQMRTSGSPCMSTAGAGDGGPSTSLAVSPRAPDAADPILLTLTLTLPLPLPRSPPPEPALLAP